MKDEYYSGLEKDKLEYLEKVGPILMELGFKEKRSHEAEKRRIEDLFMNEDFLHEIAPLRKEVKSATTKAINELDELTHKKIQLVALKYQLSFTSPLDPLWEFISDGEVSKYAWDHVDICEVAHNWPKLIKWSSSFNKKRFFERREADPDIYPVSINISNQATQRGVIQFIKDNWEAIEKAQSVVASGNAKKRRRRDKEERDKFIWAHRDISYQWVARQVRDKFDEKIYESDISSIIKKLKKRYR